MGLALPHRHLSEPNPGLWNFLRPYLDDYDAAVFTLKSFVAPEFQVGRVGSTRRPERGSARRPPCGLMGPSASPAENPENRRAGTEQKPEVIPVSAPRGVVEWKLLPAAEHVDDKDDPGRKAIPESPE